MANLSAIHVTSFYRKNVEWQTWSKTFLAKAKRHDFKDVLLGNTVIPKIDEIFDGDLEEGKKKVMIADVSELAYTKLFLSSDDK